MNQANIKAALKLIVDAYLILDSEAARLMDQGVKEDNADLMADSSAVEITVSLCGDLRDELDKLTGE